MATALSHTLLLSIWQRASAQEFGTAVEVKPEDKLAYVGGLYEVRKASNDQSLDNLMLVQPGRYPNQIWLVKKTVELDS